jgi:hypothetical protein
VLDLSSDDDFETITVKKSHVDIIASWVDLVYSDGNFMLHRHSERYKASNFLSEQEFMEMTTQN